MRIVGWVGFLALCLGLAGCNGTGKKTSLPKAARDDRPGAAAPRDDGPPLTQQTTAPAGGTGGMIAGRVVDLFNNTPPADLWIVPPADGQGAPVVRRAETDRQGYFTVQNLQPGQPYRLIAQTKDGQFQQAGEVTVRPPNARVLLQVSQDYRPTIPGGGDGGLRPSIGQPVPIDSPDKSPGPGAVIKQPIPLPEPGPSAGSPIPIRPENFAGSGQRNGARDPTIRIPGPYGPTPPHIAPPPKPAPPPSPSGGNGGPPLPEPSLSPVGATLVPSCDRRGDQLFNFALSGLDGQPWEYRRNRLPGTKLMLLDFWGTWCGPCRATIKAHVNELHAAYGRLGLEVIGIAYEKEPKFDSQVRTVQAWMPNLGIKYRVLMGAGMGTCPVAREFDVRGYPTLVLINEQGKVIWQKDGGLSDVDYSYLKALIRQQLGIR